MVALLSIALLSLLLVFNPSSASYQPEPYANNPPSGHDNIHMACKASRDPPTCQASISHCNHVLPNATVLQVIQSALWVSSRNLNKGRRFVRDILEASAGNQNLSNVAKVCTEVLYYSKYRTNMTASALSRGKIKDARAWMSAALGYQYACWGGLKHVNDSSLVGQTMAFMHSYLIPSSSNALGMIMNYDVFGDNSGLWSPPKTERDGFWDSRSISSHSNRAVGGVPSGLKANVTVCKGGHVCDYESVQQAVNAAPDKSDKRFVIWIKSGVYEETVRVPLGKKNVVFLGDGMGRTVITGSMNVRQPGINTYNSATVGVAGDRFMASGVTFQNTAGPNANQAVAFRSDSDLSVIENCEFLGNQDTLYANSLRQYYKSCNIRGNIDFIFGNSAAFFQDCVILVEPGKGENNVVTANGRTDPAQSTGFVFQNCVINGTDAYMDLYHRKQDVHKNYLGRPWKEYSRTVFMHCTMGDLIAADGWMPWNGDFALKTLYYGELENTGPGSYTSKRVSWSSQIPPQHASSYTVQNFIQGDQWIPISS